ncbi:hypothetical protein BS78_02G317900 [Paspalum vaginatum]|nr:hypothetical protein BS78_02G317500 [Paspalum vaginatum]KAJ1291476.1 hypothetical protein BS78_02G317900 [Paspalum vaginatum]
MARASSSALLVLLVALAAAAACSATRPVPAHHNQQQQQHAAAAKEADVKHPDTFQEGTVLIPGLGRIQIGSNYVPDLGGLDHSIPAAVNGQYLPGADDTWVPNPGFEVPNPFRPGAATP